VGMLIVFDVLTNFQNDHCMHDVFLCKPVLPMGVIVVIAEYVDEIIDSIRILHVVLNSSAPDGSKRNSRRSSRSSRVIPALPEVYQANII
jgi:hypothetical protein